MNEVAFAGDWHGSTDWARQMIQQVGQHPGVTHLLHTGDYGYTFTSSYVGAVEESLDRAGLQLLFVDGNHDDHAYLAGLPLDEAGFGVLSPHQRFIPRGHRFALGRTSILGLGGAVSVDRAWRAVGVSWWPTEHLTVDETLRARAGGPVDVMLTHDCPSGVTIPGLAKASGWPQAELDAAFVHRHILRGVVDKVQPRLLVHGHYHVHYEAQAGGCHVLGLDCDGSSWKDNIAIIDLDHYAQPSIS